MSALPFLASAMYLSLMVSLVVSLLEYDTGRAIAWHTGRRWGKFLLLLVILGVFVHLLTVAG